MEGSSRNRKECPQLLDLIHKGRKPWLVKRGGGTSSGSVEEKRLELRLGPPGEDLFPNQDNKPKHPKEKDSSFGCYSSMQNQKFLSCGQPGFSTPYGSSPSSAHHQMSAMESSQTCCTKVVGACHPWDTNNASPQKSCAPAPVVGWPPVGSYRKNIATSSSAKQAHSPQEANTKEGRCSKGMFVKINMDGVPIGRKVDLSACNGYKNLSSAVDALFRDLLAAQRDSHVTWNFDKVEDIKEITGLLDGSGEYTLVYEDYEGDRMLVGDVPWDMFIVAVKRLRVLKTSQLSALRRIGGKQGKSPL